MTPLRPHSEGGVRALPEAGAEPRAPELRIRTLGPPQVWLGAVPLTFRRRKSLALLVYLALTGRAHGREVLASLFVDRASDAQAREQFRTSLTGLVEQVGPFLLVTRETIALDRAQPWWLDADELQAATLGPSEGDAAADPQRLERAVALYEGPFLSGFALHDAPLFEDWMQEQRARLERLHVQALQLLLERAHEGGEGEAVLRWTTRLMAAEPWQEEAHRQLMRLLARRGQRQAALEQYAVCCRVLREEAAAVQWWSRGNGCEIRVADERDVLDTQLLAALQELEQQSRAGLLAHLITLYLQEAPAQLAALHAAVAHGDAGRVEEVAHGLRGSSMQLGATRMASLCTSLQDDAGTHNLSRAAARVIDLTREFSRVQAALQAVLQQTPPRDA